KRVGCDVNTEFESAEIETRRDESASATSDEYFQSEGVRSVFALAVERLRSRCSETQFAIFEAYELDDDRSVSYRELAQRLGITETKVTNDLAAARRRFREIVLDALREVTATEEEFRSEARALLGVAK